jgi:flagellar assembly protein FliH
LIDVSRDQITIDNGEEQIIANILSDRKKKQKSYNKGNHFVDDEDDDNTNLDPEFDNEEVEETKKEKKTDTVKQETVAESIPAPPVEVIPEEEEEEEEEIPEPEPDIQEIPENNVEEIEQKPPKPEYDFSNLIKVEYDKGFEAGKKSAMKIMENEFKKKLFSGVKGLFALTENIKKEFYDYKVNLDNYVITIALGIASKVIKHEISINNEIIISQVKEAINKVIGADTLIVHINPKDAEILRAYKDDIMDKFDSIKDLSIQINDKIEEGGCKIESRLGNVDARIETQLAVIEEALKQTIQSNNDGNKTENRE